MPTPPESDDEQRRALRKPVRLSAQLRDRGSGSFEIDVVDLSRTGFRAETSFTLYPEATVWLRLPGFAALEATVAWRDGFRYGCAFAQPLHPAVFDHIIHMADD